MLLDDVAAMCAERALLVADMCAWSKLGWGLGAGGYERVTKAERKPFPSASCVCQAREGAVEAVTHSDLRYAIPLREAPLKRPGIPRLRSERYLARG